MDVNWQQSRQQFVNLVGPDRWLLMASEACESAVDGDAVDAMQYGYAIESDDRWYKTVQCYIATPYMAISALAGTINAQLAGILQHLTNEGICTAPTHHLRCARSMRRHRWPSEHCQQIIGPYDWDGASLLKRIMDWLIKKLRFQR